MKKRIYNVSSFNREQTLIKTIESVFDQADIINVALNNYSNVPIELYDKKIRIFRTDNSKGDAFKFLDLKNSNGYFFTIDDDLIYPKDYSEYMISKVEEYGRKKIITLHGRTYKEFPISSYYNTPGVHYHCLRDVANDVKVQMGGTGVMCFDTDLFKIDIKYFKHPNMADIWIGKYAKQNNIDIICVKHRSDFLKYQDVKDTIFSSSRTNDAIQTETINNIYTKKNKIAIFTCVWQRPKLTEFIYSYYNKMIEELKDEITIQMFVAGSEGEVSASLAKKYGINYIECSNNPLSQKFNTAMQFTKSWNPDGLVLIGSDDLLSYNILKKYNNYLNNDNENSIGFTDFYFLWKDRIAYWEGYTDDIRKGEPIGCGRFYPKVLLDKINWKLWGESIANIGLDKIAAKLLRHYNLGSETFSLKEINAYAIGIQSETKITSVQEQLENQLIDCRINDEKINISDIIKIL